jgi:hypothetical protein
MTKTVDVVLGEQTITLKPLTIDQLQEYTQIADGTPGSVFKVLKYVLKECGGVADPGSLVAPASEVRAAIAAIMSLNGLATDANPPQAVPQAAD